MKGVGVTEPQVGDMRGVQRGEQRGVLHAETEPRVVGAGVPAARLVAPRGAAPARARARRQQVQSAHSLPLVSILNYLPTTA